ncbi:MAG: hypothetical protein PHT43_02835, partial [Anaerolineaceae bacterium]|nr:hypothetical protein [Anaerolineaceae bacterium]
TKSDAALSQKKSFLNSVSESLLRLSLLLAGSAGLMRAWAAWQQRETVSELGLQAWLTAYLLSLGMLFALINGFAWFTLRKKHVWHFPIITLVILLNILGYWAERLLLWAPSQRAGNSVFMAALHLLWLLLLLVYSTQRKRKV